MSARGGGEHLHFAPSTVEAERKGAAVGQMQRERFGQGAGAVGVFLEAASQVVAYAVAARHHHVLPMGSLQLVGWCDAGGAECGQEAAGCAVGHVGGEVECGGIIGSSAFVEELTRRERVAFPRERKSSPQEVCVGGLKLFALRHLKAFRK